MKTDDNDEILTFDETEIKEMSIKAGDKIPGTDLTIVEVLEPVAIAGKQYVNVWLSDRTSACIDMEYKSYKLPDNRDVGFVIQLTEEEKKKLGIDPKINAGRVGTTDLIYMNLDTETEISVDSARENAFEQSWEIEKLLAGESESELSGNESKRNAANDEIKATIIEKLKQM